MKECSRCKLTKELPDFKKDKRRLDGRSSFCKKCHVKQTTDYRKTVAGYLKYKEYRTEYVKSGKSKQVNKNALILKKYGLTRDGYLEMSNAQNNCCYICKIKREDLNYDLCVDHNHTTGKVRKLLCRPCNLVIGNCYENEKILNSAVEYLKKVCI